MNLTKAEIMSLSQNKIGPCLKIENLQGLLKVTFCLKFVININVNYEKNMNCININWTVATNTNFIIFISDGELDIFKLWLYDLAKFIISNIIRRY